MIFVLKSLFYTCISRLIGKLILRQKYETEVEIGVFIFTYIFISAVLYFSE